MFRGRGIQGHEKTMSLGEDTGDKCRSSEAPRDTGANPCGRDTLRQRR